MSLPNRCPRCGSSEIHPRALPRDAVLVCVCGEQVGPACQPVADPASADTVPSRDAAKPCASGPITQTFVPLRSNLSAHVAAASPMSLDLMGATPGAEILLSNSQKNCEAAPMSSAAAIADATDKLRWMVKEEMRGPGDAGGALDRIIKRYKLNGAAMRAPLYRDPADISLSVYISFTVAYEQFLASWEKVFEHERAIARAKTGLGRALLRLADTPDGTEAPALNDGGVRL